MSVSTKLTWNQWKNLEKTFPTRFLLIFLIRQLSWLKAVILESKFNWFQSWNDPICTGKLLLTDIKAQEEVGRLKLVNRDWKSAANRVETLLKELKVINIKPPLSLNSTHFSIQEKTEEFEEFRVKTTRELSETVTQQQFNSQATTVSPFLPLPISLQLA